jgi:hypothetical protein
MKDRGVKLVGWLIGITAALRLLQLARLHPIVWDEVLYFRCTDWVWRGLVPYRDFWMNQTPLQWFVFAPFAALTRSPGVSAILAMRWAQMPLWILTFALLWKWMRGEGLSARSTALAVLLAACSTQFALAAIEYRVDALSCALFIAALLLLQRGRGAWAGVAFCLAGFANIRFGPLIVAAVLLSRLRWHAIAGGVATFAAGAAYFVATHSAAIAFRRVWTEVYLANRYEPEPPHPFLRRLVTPLGMGANGFEVAALDLASVVILVAGAAGMLHVLATRWRVRDRLFVLVLLEVVIVAFISTIKYIYHYHFLIITLLALPFVAYACDWLLERGWRHAVAGVAVVAVAVGVFATIFRGKEDDLDYQDLVMREADRLVPAHGRVFSGIPYALRREPAYQYWFLADRVLALEKAGIFRGYDMAADPPSAVIVDLLTRFWFASHPDHAEFVRRHYRPIWPELWLPAMNARLTPQRPEARWTVPWDGTYVVQSPVPLRISIDGNPQPPSGTLTLRRRQRLEVAADIMQPTDVLIAPAGQSLQFHSPPAGVTLDSVAPPRTHLPRLW